MAQDQGENQDKGLIGTLADVFDECAEAVEELTGKPADGLRKGARVCRKTRKTAQSIEAAVVKAQKVAIKTQSNSSIPKLIHKIKNTKIVGFQPYPNQPRPSADDESDQSDPIR